MRDAAEASERAQTDDDMYNEARAVGVGSHLLPATAERDRVMMGDDDVVSDLGWDWRMMKWVGCVGDRERNSAATRLFVVSTGREKTRLHVIVASQTRGHDARAHVVLGGGFMQGRSGVK